MISQGLQELVHDNYTSVTFEQIEKKLHRSRINTHINKSFRVLPYIAMFTCLAIFALLGVNDINFSSIKSIPNGSTEGTSQLNTSVNHPVKLISKDNNLNQWDITITPYLKNNKMVCDIVIKNISNVDAEKVSFKIGRDSGNVNLVNSDAQFGLKAYSLNENDNIIVSLNWFENGKEITGKAIYTVE